MMIEQSTIFKPLSNGPDPTPGSAARNQPAEEAVRQAERAPAEEIEPPLGRVQSILERTAFLHPAAALGQQRIALTG